MPGAGLAVARSQHSQGVTPGRGRRIDAQGRSGNSSGHWRIEEVAFGGGPAWVAAGDAVFGGGASPAEGHGGEPARGVRLLPYFDAYTIASQPRELLFPGAAYERALAGGQAGNYPVVLVDGTVAGVWHQRRSGRRIAVTVEPIGKTLGAARRRELEEQVERVGEVLEAQARLTMGKVTVGPHA